jgi:thioredoxin-like negative regulator of GroEL
MRAFRFTRSPQHRASDPRSATAEGGAFGRPLRVIVLALGCLLVACGPKPEAKAPSAAELRRQALSTQDPGIAAHWLLAELILPGGDAARARRARAKLDSLGKGGGMLAELVRGLDDSLHGRLEAAPDEFLAAAREARVSRDPRAPYVAWYSVERALALTDDSTELMKRWQPFVQEAIHAPRSLGWRARAALVSWWLNEQEAAAKPHVEELTASELGCVRSVRLAGPFGSGAQVDWVRSFPAESSGPWPLRWDSQPGVSETPRVLRTKRHACSISADEPVGKGVFYAETYLELDTPRTLLLTPQGAVAFWVDDRLVVDRDPRRWGVWPKLGVSLSLSAGRHRLLARLSTPDASLRVLEPDGLPAQVRTSADPSRPYSSLAPTLLADPNLISRFVRDGDVVDPGDDVLRWTAASLASAEGQQDIATLLMEPLVKDIGSATGPALATAAVFTAGDPIYEATQAQDLVHELDARAVDKDGELYISQLALAVWDAERAGPAEAARRLRALCERFPQVPELLAALAHTYDDLGWRPERIRTVQELYRRFPNRPDSMRAAIESFDEMGETATADQLVDRIVQQDPDSEIRLTRALNREDYETALAELRRLSKRRPDRKELVERIHAVMQRAGDERETWKQLEAAVKKNPREAAPRMALADARLADRQPNALRDALVGAVVHGAPTSSFEEALALVEGMTELEPYRVAARDVIDAYEREGRHMPGTAARVLDYSAVWVRSDGSSRMLEHEIVRIQSAEAIADFAEQQRLTGLTLHMRVIKQDGTEFEPEYVPGKPTVTLPHLEVGDYVETEHIMSLPGIDRFGSSYVSPQWFFREANVAYARSEFIVISPANRPLSIETQGAVPPPVVEQHGAFVSRRWRVDFSPAAPVEPFSAPAVESLPNVRVGWGVTLKRRLSALADRVEPMEPVDPRIGRAALRIVKPVANGTREQKAKLLFRWILENVEPGDETDGRRVVIGRKGNRWHGFMMLCRALDIPVEYVVARDRFDAPAVGPLSLAQQYAEPVLMLTGERGPVWLTLGESEGAQREKYLPFAYLPPGLRRTDAYVIESDKGPTRVRIPNGAGSDEIRYEGEFRLSANGSAEADLVLRSTGRHAMDVRGGLAQLGAAQIRDALEGNVVGRALRGARLLKHEVRNMDDVDRPLDIVLKVHVPNFAQRVGRGWTISPPFTPSLSRLTVLPSRKTTMILNAPVDQTVRLRIQLPAGFVVTSPVGKRRIADGERTLVIQDRVEQDTLVLDRTLHVPANRIEPGQYPGFVRFAQSADDALAQAIQVSSGT